MPPQGLLLIAAYMPESWEVRFIDENIRRATADDFAWADVVFVSGMHIQAPQIRDIRARAHARRQGRRCSAGHRSRARPRCIRTSTICISARSATRPTQLIAHARRRRVAARRRRCASRPTSACRSPISRSPPIEAIAAQPLSDRHRCSSRAAAPIAASSATSRRSTAASRG